MNSVINDYNKRMEKAKYDIKLACIGIYTINEDCLNHEYYFPCIVDGYGQSYCMHCDKLGKYATPETYRIGT